MKNQVPLGIPVASVQPMASVTPRRMAGDFVSLLPVDPRYAADLYDGSHGSREAEEIWAYLSYGPFAELDEMQKWLADLVDSNDPLFFVVLAEATGKAVGMASYLNIDRAMRRIEIGHIWYVPSSQRTAVNTEVAFLLLSHAFSDLDARRVEWRCDSLNARSRAAAIRLGFTFEGVLRQHMIVKGRNRDTAVYGMSDDDWSWVRPVMKRWLYEDHHPQWSLGQAMEEARAAVSEV